MKRWHEAVLKEKVPPGKGSVGDDLPQVKKRHELAIMANPRW